MNRIHPSWDAVPGTIRFALAAAASAEAVREPAFRVLDALQTLPAARQLEAVFAAGVMLARGAGIDPHELVSRAKRQVPEIEGVETAASAISDYAKGELRA